MRNNQILYLTEILTFLDSIDPKASAKIIYNIQKVLHANFLDSDLFKKLDDEIWEFRTLYNGVQYRLLAFWCPYTESLIIASNGFIKKTQKTPLKELNRARLIRKQYLLAYEKK
ncbi:type II toxin-antitoxin system RelE/ParE family toxin [Myroides odoratus]|uniref:type II toxin-antitoxin system RelE/ParE family toxin n=1 Tax=Myroides odoratus TaxID=256 RepID=UPI00333E5C06